MLIGVTGTNGGGKGAVVDYLEHTKGFAHYSVRDLIMEEILRRGLPADRPNFGRLATELRAELGADHFIRLSLERAQERGQKDVVIESVRALAEARGLHAAGGVLIAVDAPLALRYQRIVGRGSATDRVTLEEFRAQEDAEYRSADPSDPARMNVLGVMAIADETIVNDGTLDELHAKIDAFLAA